MTYNQMLTNHRFTNPMARSFTKLSDFLSECKVLKGPEGADVTKVYLDSPTVEKDPAASRNKNHGPRKDGQSFKGQNRFSPHNRPNRGRNEDKKGDQASLHCDKCGSNPSHDTRGHKECTYRPCLKVGHLENECRMKQRHAS
ncbi:hypothetical protein BGW38_009906, partial [Lunasporangiospora selenospora]